MNKISKILMFAVIALVCISCSKGRKVIVSTYDNGKPCLVYYMKKINGVDTKVYEQRYYPNDQLRSEGKCKGDKRLGTWKFYFKNGDLFAKTDFTNKKEGESWEVWRNKNEKIVDKKDKLRTIAFSNEGTLVSIKIEKNNDNEIFYRFFNSFNLFEKWNLKGNIPNGEAISWFENGNINSIHHYKYGLQDNTYIVYAENGQKIISGQYNKGVKVGKWEYFNSNGQVSGSEIYDANGVRLTQKQDNNLIYIGKDGKEIKQ